MPGRVARFIFAGMLMCIAAGCARGQPPKAAQGWGGISALLLNEWRLELDRDVTFKTVADSLGPAPAVHPRQHGDDTRICYAARVSADTIFVVFHTNDLGGPEQRVLGFTLSTRRDSTLSERACVPTLRAITRLRASNNVAIGMRLDSAVALLGRTPVRRDGEYQFGLDTTVAPGPASSCSIKTEACSKRYSTVIRAPNERVSYLRVWFAETY